MFNCCVIVVVVVVVFVVAVVIVVIVAVVIVVVIVVVVVVVVVVYLLLCYCCCGWCWWLCALYRDTALPRSPYWGPNPYSVSTNYTVGESCMGPFVAAARSRSHEWTPLSFCDLFFQRFRAHMGCYFFLR